MPKNPVVSVVIDAYFLYIPVFELQLRHKALH